MHILHIIGARHAARLTCVSELLPQPTCQATVTPGSMMIVQQDTEQQDTEQQGKGLHDQSRIS
jgi:hypothetical protein